MYTYFYIYIYIYVCFKKYLRLTHVNNIILCLLVWKGIFNGNFSYYINIYLWCFFYIIESSRFAFCFFIFELFTLMPCFMLVTCVCVCVCARVCVCVCKCMVKCSYNYLELVQWKFIWNSWSNMMCASYIYIDLATYIFDANNIVVLL